MTNLRALIVDDDSGIRETLSYALEDVGFSVLEAADGPSGLEKARAEIPDVLYEAGRAQLSLRVPDDPALRFPAVVRLADVLLQALREPEPAPTPAG